MNKILTNQGQTITSHYQNPPFFRKRALISNQYQFNPSIENKNNISSEVLQKKNTSTNSNFITQNQMIEENLIEERLNQFQNQKQNLFELNDQSVGLSPPVQLSIQISDLSDEQLFTPKINITLTQASSPTMEKFYLNIRQTKSFFQLATLQGEDSNRCLEQYKNKSNVRRQKVMRYLQKKNNRNFKKKVSYHSRKTVADSRLRVKGRFVTKFQAQLILGDDISRLNNKQIKLLLQRHYSS